jgi:hypothetical protein
MATLVRAIEPGRCGHDHCARILRRPRSGAVNFSRHAEIIVVAYSSQ